MMPSILHIRSVNDYAHYIGAEVLHPLVSVIHYDELTAIGQRYGLTCSQTAIAWALTKGVLPIIGATKPHHVTEAAQVGDTRLTADEVAKLESLADKLGIDTRGGWEGKA